MKNCAIIAEYNPLHLGHVKQIAYVKEVLGAQNVIVIMSGNFTQRGEPSIMNKYKRAKHAILAGADMVIELPTVFATANAEIFAKGAIKILNALGDIDGICFGVESGEKEDYIALANALNNESREYKKLLKEKLETGISLAKAKFLALKELGGDFKEELINSPNNILGLEYTKAIIEYSSNIEIYPMKREGNHNDRTYKKGITSASSIRNMIKLGKTKKVKSSVPKFVYKDFTEYPFCFEKLYLLKLLTESADNMANITDCTEGLENRIKALLKDNKTLEGLIEKVCTKRYTETRIRRIMTANLLGIKNSLVKNSLSSLAYAKILAVNSNKIELVSDFAKSSSIPLITRKSDTKALKGVSNDALEIDILANDIFNLALGEKENEFFTLFL